MPRRHSCWAAVSADVKRWNERNPDKPVLLIMMGAEAASLTRRDCHFYAFRTSTNADMRVKALAKALSENGRLGTSVFAINQDCSWGREMDRAVEDDAATYEYEVVGSVLHDVSKIQDFSPYVERIRESGAETVVTGNWARDLLLLMQSAGLVVPRAIGWISTVSAAGVPNLAPYSFFTVASTSPPHLLFSSAGAAKDGAVNARETGQFVVNIADETLVEELVASSAAVAPRRVRLCRPRRRGWRGPGPISNARCAGSSRSGPRRWSSGRWCTATSIPRSGRADG